MFCSKCGKENIEGSDFCGFCGASLKAPAEGNQQNTPHSAFILHEDGPPRTSGLAIASLILAILGLVSGGLTTIVGLVLGIISLGQIRRSRGQLKGEGLAISGIVVSSVIILVLPAILFPVFAKARQKAKQASCMNHIKQLALAMQMYAMDFDERYPPSSNWCDALDTYVISKDVYVCPATEKSSKCSYAFNAVLGGAHASVISRPDSFPMLFDAESGWNVSGGSEIAVKRHLGSANVAFADGHVKSVKDIVQPESQFDPSLMEETLKRQYEQLQKVK